MRKPLLGSAILAVGLLAGCASGDATSPADDGAAIAVNGSTAWHGTPVKNGYRLPDLRFTDTAGHQVDLAEAATKPVTLVFFGYSHCPDICNVVMANIAAALREASPAVRHDVRLLFVTTDPARDKPEVLREFLDRFDPSFEGLIAPVGTVARAARALYISYEKPDGSRGGSYEVDHGTYTTGFLDGTAKVIWAETTTVANLRADLTRLSRLA